jgi:peptidoglycan/LPS O-acetylase OafA/YrhL
MKPVTYLSNLTPMRGIAALLTVIYHVDLFLGNGGNSLIKFKDSMVLTRMYLMVDFFFILSGFIMCHVYGNWFSESVKIADFKKFTIARFARVYPLHFVTLLYTILLFAISAQLGIPKNTIIQVENSFYSVCTNLFLLQSMNLHHWFSWVHASWSISTEWWAYMVFPFLVRPLSRLGSLAKGSVAFLCFLGYLGITVYLTPYVVLPKELSFLKSDPSQMSINVAFQYGYLRCLCGFILGMMMYQGFKSDWGKKVLGNGYVLLLLTFGFLLSMHFAWPDVITVAFFPFIMLSGAFGSRGIDRVFANKSLQRLGDWSFSIYLVHQPLMFTFSNISIYFKVLPTNFGVLNAWITCLVVVAIILLVSALVYRVWEVPARKWINAKAG